MLFESRRSRSDALWSETRAAARPANEFQRVRASKRPAKRTALIVIGLALAVGCALSTMSLPTTRSFLEWLMPLAE